MASIQKPSDRTAFEVSVIHPVNFHYRKSKTKSHRNNFSASQFCLLNSAMASVSLLYRARYTSIFRTSIAIITRCIKPCIRSTCWLGRTLLAGILRTSGTHAGRLQHRIHSTFWRSGTLTLACIQIAPSAIPRHCKHLTSTALRRSSACRWFWFRISSRWKN